MSIFNQQGGQETAAQADAAIRSDAEAQMRSGGSWFYWIAGISLLNSIITMTGGQWNFIVGLGATQAVDGVLRSFGDGSGFNGFNVVALMVNVLITAVFALFGYAAVKGSVLAFLVGMFFYILDAGLFIFVEDYWAVGFHAFALFFIGRGMLAAVEFNKMSKSAPMVQN